MSDDTVYIGCECGSPYHIVRTSFYEYGDTEPPELYLELQADRHLGFWERVQHAVRYVLGEENLGWHDVIPVKADIVKLHELTGRYLKAYEAYEAKQNG
jgi:hypothetical protein